MGDDRPSWVVPALLVGLYLLVVGVGFAVYAAHIDPVGGEAIVPGFDPGDRGMTAQRAYGFLAAGTLAAGGMLLLFGALSYVFNLLASVITLSVLLGCMALVVVLALMTGLEEDLRHKILDQRGHVRITRKDGRPFGDYAEVVAAVLEEPGIAGASPYLEGEIMLRSGLQRQAGILIGIDPQRHTTISNLPDIVVAGDYGYLERPEEIPEPDPFARTDDAPFRLRHLAPKRRRAKGARSRDRAADGGASGGGSGGGARAGSEGGARGAATDTTGADDDPTEDEPETGGTSGPDAPEGAKAAFDADVADPPLPPVTRTFGTLGRLPPPPTGVRAPPAEEGWEDPSEVLGLRPEAPAPSAAGADSSADGDLAEDEASASPPEDTEPPARASTKVLPALVIGREMEMELGVTVGDRVQLITPIGRLTPAGRMPGILSARVGAIFYSGMYEFDRKNVYAPLGVVQAFLRTGDRVSGIEVRLVDPEDVDAGKAAVEAAVSALGRDDELLVQDWRDLNRNLFSAMFLEKVAMFVALLFVVLVASFGILASNLMSVIEKAKDIAILKAMGATDRQILRVFTAEGLVVGLLGSIGGISAGLLLAWALGRFGLPISEAMLYSEDLPVVVEPTEVVLVGVAALAIVWVSSLYPAFVASRLPPVAGLRKADR
ncbi:MAG: FtsX-like permease family protein [Deltaproteobacteria bacterium]|nr:MAG: FtsX-like permease family protein [Deltaproteobacteria bacterium]